MSLQFLGIESINEEALDRLVSDSVGESSVLEYKEAFVAVTDEQKREFLSDATAFANTDGGDLIYGIIADKGVPTSIRGIKNLVPDDVVLKIENLLRDSIQPRISGVQIRCLQLLDGSNILIVRIPRSFAAPHMVRHQGVTKFCGRNSNGKYDLDVHQLRSSFVGSETISEKLKSFRLERINRILSGNPAVPLGGSNLVVLHILPLVGTRPESRIAPQDLSRQAGSLLLMPMHCSGSTTLFNLDGVVNYCREYDGSNGGYVQVFRNGFLEAVECNSLRPWEQAPGLGIRKTIGGGLRGWEDIILKGFVRYLRSLLELNINPPFAVSLSFLNVRGYNMSTSASTPYFPGGTPVDRDNLLTDEIIIESTGGDAGRALRPLFDQIWNACGFHGSPHYDEKGDRRT